MNAAILKSAVTTVWFLDDLGEALYECSPIGKAVLDEIRGEA